MTLNAATQSDSDWPFVTQSRVLHVYWYALDNHEKAILHHLRALLMYV